MEQSQPQERPEESGSQPRERGGSPRPQSVLLALIAVVLIAAALKFAKMVFLPLVFAGFLIGVLWPIYNWLRVRLPRVFATLAALFVFVAFLGLIGAGVWYSVDVMSNHSAQYAQRLEQLTGDARSWMAQRGLDVIDPADLEAAASSVVKSVGADTGKLLTGLVLALAYLALGLLEVRDYGQRLGRKGGRLERLSARVARDMQRYLLVRTFIGLLTGVAVTLGSWAVGLAFPLLWGMLNFLLNYVPTVGSVLGVIPPTLFALVQFEDPMMALLVLGVVGGIQLVMGNYVDPLLQGKYMELSPVVVLFSVTFWGYLWDAVGALIAVPLTVLAVLICREFESTRFVALLLAREPVTAERSPRRAPGSSTQPADARANQ